MAVFLKVDKVLGGFYEQHGGVNTDRKNPEPQRLLVPTRDTVPDH